MSLTPFKIVAPGGLLFSKFRRVHRRPQDQYGDIYVHTQSDLTTELKQAIIEVVRAEVRTALSLACNDGREFLTIREAMVVLNISRSEIYRRFKAGDLTLVKRGRRSLICAKEVAAFAERLRGTACNAGAPT